MSLRRRVLKKQTRNTFGKGGRGVNSRGRFNGAPGTCKRFNKVTDGFLFGVCLSMSCNLKRLFPVYKANNSQSPGIHQLIGDSTSLDV